MTNDNPPHTGTYLIRINHAKNHFNHFCSEKLDVDAMNYFLMGVLTFPYLCHGYVIWITCCNPVPSSSTTDYYDPPLRRRMDQDWISSLDNKRRVYGLKAELRKLEAGIYLLTGSCRFGDACKYLHNGVHGKSTLLPRTSGSASSVSGVTRLDLDMLQSLLAKFGLNAPNISTPSPPVAYTVSVPPGFQRGSVSDGVTTGGGPLSTAGGSDAFWSTAGGLPYTWNFTAANSVYDSGSTAARGFFPCRSSDIIARGELYPVTKPSTIPHAFLTSQYTWHQRLGHLGSEVLRRLVSSDYISCNKEKLPILCHVCQLGKHVKLPFVSSSSSVTSCFDIVHSDLWTTPIRVFLVSSIMFCF
ncbi:ribonuclease H-like domain-containing protein [Tanacetum coccineum]